MSKAVKEAVQNALLAEDPLANPNPIWLAPVLGGDSEVISTIKKMDSLNIEKNIQRIAAEADPIGFLMAVMMGIPVPVFTVNGDGSLTSTLQTASLKDRTIIAKDLAAKVVPKMTMKFSPKSREPGDAAAFAAVVENAAGRDDG